MKHKLFSLLLAGIMGVLAVHAQTDYAKLGIERKVLFTMNKNEICTYADTYNPYKGVDNIKACEIFVIDTIRKITTYVYNGERICTGICAIDEEDPGDNEYNEYTGYFGNWGIDPAHTWDMPSRDSLVVMYLQQDGEYIQFGKELVYGPYNAIGYIGWNKFAFTYEDPEESDAIYIHDADGMVYQAKGQGRTFFQSPNKKHSAMVAPDNIFKIRVDNVPYTLDSLIYRYDERYKVKAEVSVFDDGSCLVEYYYSFAFAEGWGIDSDWDSDRGKRMMHSPAYSSQGGYYIKNGNVRLLAENEYFDKKDQTIKEKAKKESNDEYISFEIKNDDTWRRDKYGRINAKYYAKLWENLMTQSRYGYNCWDKKHEHQLFTIPGLGYILVDGMAIKSDYPLCAFRNTIVNAFRWIVVEGNEVVYYSYQIP